jgi:hypothetical protein
MAGVVHIPWYATVFRADRLAAALQEIAPVAVRYGATQWRLHQSRDDAYKFDHMIWFESRDDWNRFWEGPELVAFRARVGGWYQVPLLYVWNEELAFDIVEPVVTSGTSGGASVTAPQGAETAA